MRLSGKLATTALVLASAVAAQAALITGGTGTVSPSLTNFNESMVFNRFDTTIGTLDAVEIHAQSGVASDVELINISKPVTKTITLNGKIFTQTRAQAADGVAYTQVLFNFLVGGSNVMSYTVKTGSASYALPAKDDSTATGQLDGDSGDQSVSLTAPALLNVFKGSGSISANSDAASSVIWVPDATNNGLVATNDFTAADMTVTIIYHYTPVPEPTTLGLLGLGALFLGRRRNA